MWNQERHHPKPPRPLKPSFVDNTRIWGVIELETSLEKAIFPLKS